MLTALFKSHLWQSSCTLLGDCACRLRSWYKDMIKANMLASGMQQSGWMCDFGEYIPYDAVLDSGVPATVVHNQLRGRTHGV